MKVNLTELKKSLSECHLTKDDPKAKFIVEVADGYLHNRIIECLHACQRGEDVVENSRLGIQLFNLLRTRAIKNGTVQSKTEPKDGTGS